LRATARYSAHTFRVRAPSAPPFYEESLSFVPDAIVEIAPFLARWVPTSRPASCSVQVWDSAAEAFALEWKTASRDVVILSKREIFCVSGDRLSEVRPRDQVRHSARLSDVATGKHVTRTQSGCKFAAVLAHGRHADLRHVGTPDCDPAARTPVNPIRSDPQELRLGPSCP
jgi:hypothetical protein